MLSITRVALATQPNRNKGPSYGTYLTIATSAPVGKGHRECIVGAIATFNNQQPAENKKFRLGFNGSIVIGRTTISQLNELAELVNFVACCIGHEGELPGLEADEDLINPGLTLVLPGSNVAKFIRPEKVEQGHAVYKGRRPRRRES